MDKPIKKNEDILLIILLILLVLLGAFFLFLPKNKDQDNTDLPVNEEKNVVKVNPTTIAKVPQDICLNLCKMRGSISVQVRNDDNVLTCVCENGYERVMGLAE